MGALLPIAAPKPVGPKRAAKGLAAVPASAPVAAGLPNMAKGFGGGD